MMFTIRSCIQIRLQTILSSSQRIDSSQLQINESLHYIFLLEKNIHSKDEAKSARIQRSQFLLLRIVLQLDRA